MMRTVPVVAGRWPMRSSSVLVLAALPVVWSAVLPSQSRIDVSAGGSTSQTTATAFVESDGVEAGATGRFMRSEQTAQASGRGGDTEMLQPAAFEQDTLEETSIQLQTPKPSDECAWANWFEWGACTKTCGSGRRTRSRLGTGLYAEYFFFGQGNTLPDLNGKTPNVKRIDLWVAYQDTLAAWVGLSQKENFAARWTGSLSIITGGSYFFELQSHDGARLKLNVELDVDEESVQLLQSGGGKAIRGGELIDSKTAMHFFGPPPEHTCPYDEQYVIYLDGGYVAENQSLGVPPGAADMNWDTTMDDSKKWYISTALNFTADVVYIRSSSWAFLEGDLTMSWSDTNAKWTMQSASGQTRMQWSDTNAKWSDTNAVDDGVALVNTNGMALAVREGKLAVVPFDRYSPVWQVTNLNGSCSWGVDPTAA